VVPNLTEAYRRQGKDLAASLDASEENRPQAHALLCGLIEKITLARPLKSGQALTLKYLDNWPGF
jgi:hypothetical protein